MPDIPKHKRFTYFNAGNDAPIVAVVTKPRMWHAIQTVLTYDERKNCRTDEEMFEKTFRVASRFGVWLDHEWRTE